MRQITLTENDSCMFIDTIDSVMRFIEKKQSYGLISNCFKRQEHSTLEAIKDANIAVLMTILQKASFCDNSFIERTKRLIYAFNFAVREYQLADRRSARSLLCDSRYDKLYEESKRPFLVKMFSKEKVVFDFPDDIYSLISESIQILDLLIRWNTDELFEYFSQFSTGLIKDEFLKCAKELSSFDRSLSDYLSKGKRLMEAIV